MNSKLTYHPVTTSLVRYLFDYSATGTGSSAGESVLALADELNRRVYGLFGLSEDEINIIEGRK
jgi:hypothetical protein